MTEERKLIAAAKAGSVAAFTDLVRSYQLRLLRFLVTRCNSVADAEDALQDTLLNAFRYLHTYDARWRFSTWLYRIAIRNAHRHTSVEMLDVDNLSDAEADPLSLCIKQGETQNLWVCARRVLNDEVFTAMWLRYVEELSVNDVGKALDRSTSWSKVNLLRGRKKLEEEMNTQQAESNVYG